jgi:hypothetical protein
MKHIKPSVPGVKRSTEFIERRRLPDDDKILRDDGTM